MLSLQFSTSKFISFCSLHIFIEQIERNYIWNAPNKLSRFHFCGTGTPSLQYALNALCRSWQIGFKVVNFDKSFLHRFLHRAVWTQNLKKIKFKKDKQNVKILLLMFAMVNLGVKEFVLPNAKISFVHT